MNKTRQTKSVHSKAIPLVVGVVIVLGVGLGILHQTHTWFFKKALTTAQLDATQQQTDHPSPKNNNPPTKSTTSATPTGSQTSNEVPVDPSFSASITQLEETNDEVNFTASVQNTQSAGTCVVTFSTPNDRPVTQQFTATNDGSTSTCGPISINANEFSYLGTWQVAFHYYVGDQQATAQGTITIK
jgi:cytoskeletal protein RodZ